MNLRGSWVFLRQRQRGGRPGRSAEAVGSVEREYTRGEIGRRVRESGTRKAKGREWIGDLQGTEEGWMDWGRKSGDE